MELQDSQEDSRLGSDERMRRFLADASSELRPSPAAIQLLTELYRRDEGMDVAAAMASMDAESRRMSRILDELVMHARMDSEFPLEHQPVDLRELLEDVVRAVHADTPQRAVRLLDSLDGPCVVLGDRIRLRQALSTLLREVTPGARPEAVTTVHLLSRVDRMRIEVSSRRFASPLLTESPCGAAGLRLTMVRSIIAGHAGLMSEDLAPNGDLTLVVELPQNADSGPSAG
ncbi:sensor histidine kinase [Nocardia sp. NPDC059240]|uniref:sensor histidine kinase n=1 Tax=Nocardia sp. NPDC059240 TaxID=3346786 RepID=UPI00369075F3